MQPVKVPMCANNFNATRSPSAHRQKIKIPLKNARTLFNQASRLCKTGDADDFAAARSFYERALAISEKNLGPEHPVIANILGTVACYLEDAGDLAAARSLYERALAINEKALGPEHPDIAEDLRALAYHLQDAGDLHAARARQLFERALAIKEKTLGPEHPEVADYLTTLALHLQTDNVEDCAIARSLYERALAIYEKAFGPEHPEVAYSLTDLALCLYRPDDAESCAVARPLYERALAIIEACYGPSSAEAGFVLYQLGVVLSELKEFDQAETLLRRGLDITIEQSGINNPLTLDPLGHIEKLADLLEAKGDLSGMAALSKEYLTPLKISEKTDPEELLRIKRDIAISLYNAEQNVEAEPLIQEVLDFSLQLFGKHTLEAASDYHAMGLLQRKKGDLTKAKKFFKRALQISTAELGADHEATKFVMSRLEGLAKL